MSRRRVSNPLALAVLASLTERAMHPYEIATTLRSRGKHESIKLNYGSLYSVVESLQKHGLIVARESSRDGRRPERTVYEITAAGRSEFEEWLAELIATPVRDFTSLEAGLSLMAGLPPQDVSRLLTDRLVALRMELGRIDAGLQVSTQMGLPEVFTVEGSLRRAMITAEIAFVADLVARIDAGTFGGVGVWQGLHDLQARGLSFEEIMSDPVGHLGEEARILAQQPKD